eukprot:1994308-Pleurochrysis_carterae.AAC.3
MQLNQYGFLGARTWQNKRLDEIYMDPQVLNDWYLYLAIVALPVPRADCRCPCLALASCVWCGRTPAARLRVFGTVPNRGAVPAVYYQHTKKPRKSIQELGSSSRAQFRSVCSGAAAAIFHAQIQRCRWHIPSQLGEPVLFCSQPASP